MKITEADLHARAACPEGCKAFKDVFPNGMEVTKKNLYKWYSQVKHPNAHAFAYWYLKNPLSQRYLIKFSDTIVWLDRFSTAQKAEWLWAQLKKEKIV